MRRLLNAGVLALTALVLLATVDRAPPSGTCTAGPLVPGPTQLSVETTCGSPGTVTVTVDADTCEVTLDGAAAVGLPSRGSSGTSLTLQDGDAPRHCTCDERAPGEWNVRCYDLHSSGCGGSDLPACDGTLRLAAP